MSSYAVQLFEDLPRIKRLTQNIHAIKKKSQNMLVFSHFTDVLKHYFSEIYTSSDVVHIRPDNKTELSSTAHTPGSFILYIDEATLLTLNKSQILKQIPNTQIQEILFLEPCSNNIKQQIYDVFNLQTTDLVPSGFVKTTDLPLLGTMKLSFSAYLRQYECVASFPRLTQFKHNKLWSWLQRMYNELQTPDEITLSQQARVKFDWYQIETLLHDPLTDLKMSAPGVTSFDKPLEYSNISKKMLTMYTMLEKATKIYEKMAKGKLDKTSLSIGDQLASALIEWKKDEKQALDATK